MSRSIKLDDVMFIGNSKYNSHRTAITRTALSAPAKFLSENGFLGGNQLDYGSGRGFDAKKLGIDRYDPVYWPYLKRYKFGYDCIMCNYVLNVLKDDSDMKWLFYKIDGLLRKDGLAFITVRRDIKKEGFTSVGTYQHNVELELTVLHETSSYCIYLYSKGDYKCLNLFKNL